ncbi:hypothetical protein [Amycolatopsis sp. YIM 10]|uniref:hypothetical protein n=1 Tax=Amycolatopsis sp. YIM 10 TaxID=2653857 RepID=UPI00129076E8|nr:hypothetical protein [Amycolatopsis sp. YIM 10]
MTGPNVGEPQVDVTELLAALAAAERTSLDSAEGQARPVAYRAGLVDGYAEAQTVVRKLAGWPIEAASDRT